MLKEIGRQLDQHVFPRVVNGGFVVPNELAVPLTLGTEKHHERRAKRGSAAGSRQGTSGRQGTPGRAWASGGASPVVGADLEAQYEVELGGLAEQYPGAQFWHQDEGVWLLTNSGLLARLRQHALFLTGISFPAQMVRSWAFWGDPIAFPSWIGPRHTNFPDGSVCAFEPADGTWCFGDPIVDLLDLFTVWALRHLHLEEFGRWPGHQAIHFAGERILELRADEHCSCENSDKLYGECCMPKDMTGNRIGACLAFFWRTGGVRQPPRAVTDFVRHGKEIPPLSALVPKPI